MTRNDSDSDSPCTNQQEQQPVQVTALQDLIAGGVAGSASVIVGHPFDTYKVRLQTSSAGAPSFSTFGGFATLFRGMAPPLSTAAVVNALIFSSYGESSRIWDDFFADRTNRTSSSAKDQSGTSQDQSTSSSSSASSWQKAFVCGSFAGGVQALIICPSDHIKCRLQVQHAKHASTTPTVSCTTTAPTTLFKGPLDAVDKILNAHGVRGLYRGFICTVWREVPAFGLYFATYDFVKESVTNILISSTKKSKSKMVLRHNNNSNSMDNEDTTSKSQNQHHHSASNDHDSSFSIEPPVEENSSHRWAASALAGGFSGALTWAAIYPFDVIKTRIQTSPLDTPIEKRRITYIYRTIVNEQGAQFFFRGLGVTLLRAFPVNAIIFPVYEFTLFELTQRGIGTLDHRNYLESV